MFHTKRAVIFSSAFVPRRALSVVAVHAIVVDSSTMIGCDVAAKVTFILNVVLLMLLTVGNAKLVICFLTVEFALRALKVVLV